MSDSSGKPVASTFRMIFRESGNTGHFRIPGPSGCDGFEIPQMRRALADRGCHLVFRLTDDEVLQEWHRIGMRQNRETPTGVDTSAIARVPTTYGVLAQSEAKIRTLLSLSMPNTAELRELFDRAVNALKFLGPENRNQGALYSGQFQVTSSGARSRDGNGALGNISMRDTALSYAKKRGKKPIDWTPGYRWLRQWDLERLLGSAEAFRLWQSASLRYVQTLSGRVIIFLANPELADPDINNFAGVFRSVEGRAVYENAEVTQIFHRIEHAVHGVTKSVIGPKVVRGKRVFFMFGDAEP